MPTGEPNGRKEGGKRGAKFQLGRADFVAVYGKLKRAPLGAGVATELQLLAQVYRKIIKMTLGQGMLLAKVESWKISVALYAAVKTVCKKNGDIDFERIFFALFNRWKVACLLEANPSGFSL